MTTAGLMGNGSPPGFTAKPVEELYGDDHTLVICATSRLSQALRQQQARAMVQAGHTQWTPLQALTFDQWLASLQTEVSLQGMSEAPALQALPMDSAQERILWEQVIRENLLDQAHDLFDVAALAKTAMEAHELSIIWEVHAQPHQLNDESRRFIAWQQRFVARCAQQGWIDQARLHRALLETLPDCFHRLRWPKQVAFAGFTRLNPVERQLQSLLQSRGIELLVVTSTESKRPDTTAAPVQCQSYPDTASEALAAALWVQQQWQANPQARLAIVVPDLAGSRHILEDTLEDVLMPSAISPSQAEAARPFNISLGLPLSHKPLVQAALTLLQVLADADKLPQPAMGQLLRNPYWSNAAQETAARALLDAAMREHLPPAAPLAQLQAGLRQQMADRHGEHRQAPQLMRHLDQLVELLPQLQDHRLPSDWAERLPVLLRQVGWLVERKLSSHEYQAKEALLDAIHQLARTDDWLGRVSYPVIVAHLRRACADRTFQVQTEGQPTLQILGVLETSGLTFDGTWVMGMVDTAWPPAARPNALLPSEVQRERQSPHASATVQLQFAQALQTHLVSCAPQVTFSWPRKLGDAELNPSPLLPPTDPEDHKDTPASPHWTKQAAQGPNRFLCAPIEDATAPPVGAGERVSGGTWMLRAQAICPAWAFYQYRLGAAKMEQPTEGLDAAKRGTFLHDALEHFWKDIKTSKRLHELKSDARRTHVETAVDMVLAAYNQDTRHAPLKPRFAQLERARLVRLIMGWLDVELQRSQHFEVIHSEKECVLEIEGIQVRMYIDRIDLLTNGSTLVIDYKTGASIDIKSWASDRLTEPQLPIYAALAPPTEGPVQGVVFAKVLMQGPTWAGLAKEDKLLPKVIGLDSKPGRRLFPEALFPHWNSVLGHWSLRIRAVAQEVKAGHAGVRFADAKALKYCDVLPVLRLAERQAQLEAEQAATRLAGDAQ